MEVTLTTKGPCAACGPERNFDVVAAYTEGYDWGEVDHRIVRCRGCNRVRFESDKHYNEHHEDRNHYIEYWPKLPKRRAPLDLVIVLMDRDADLARLFCDIYVAMDNSLDVLTAIAIRTVFDRASEAFGVDPATTFQKKLAQLQDLGKIGDTERTNLAVLVDAGSAAAHRGWRPTSEQLDRLVSIIENFLLRNFVLNPAGEVLRSTIPPRQTEGG